MTLRAFITENREAIDDIIRRHHSTARINHEERRLWILNHEGLYLWAKNEGVRI